MVNMKVDIDTVVNLSEMKKCLESEKSLIRIILGK